jgi:hypothetical protein
MYQPLMLPVTSRLPSHFRFRVGQSTAALYRPRKGANCSSSRGGAAPATFLELSCATLAVADAANATKSATVLPRKAFTALLLASAITGSGVFQWFSADCTISERKKDDTAGAAQLSFRAQEKSDADSLSMTMRALALAWCGRARDARTLDDDPTGEYPQNTVVKGGHGTVQRPRTGQSRGYNPHTQ